MASGEERDQQDGAAGSAVTASAAVEGSNRGFNHLSMACCSDSVTARPANQPANQPTSLRVNYK
jgi:hypothetical protein